jgi:hypothetical protein
MAFHQLSFADVTTKLNPLNGRGNYTYVPPDPTFETIEALYLVSVNVTLRRVRVIIVAVEKQ